jgi:hypothetical protein
MSPSVFHEFILSILSLIYNPSIDLGHTVCNQDGRGKDRLYTAPTRRDHSIGFASSCQIESPANLAVGNLGDSSHANSRIYCCTYDQV